MKNLFCVIPNVKASRAQACRSSTPASCASAASCGRARVEPRVRRMGDGVLRGFRGATGATLPSELHDGRVHRHALEAAPVDGPGGFPGLICRVAGWPRRGPHGDPARGKGALKAMPICRRTGRRDAEGIALRRASGLGPAGPLQAGPGAGEPHPREAVRKDMINLEMSLRGLRQFPASNGRSSGHRLSGLRVSGCHREHQGRSCGKSVNEPCQPSRPRPWGKP